MNSEEYIAELTQRLAGMSEAEIHEAIAYCEEYFNEAADDEAAISELGSPCRFAAQLKAESVMKEVQNENTQKHPNVMKSLLWMFMGICALPIALPLALTAAILLGVVILLLFVFALLIVILLGVCIYVAVASFITGIINITAPADLIMHLGFSILCIGIAGFSFLAAYVFIKKFLPFFIKQLSDFYYRHGRRTER